METAKTTVNRILFNRVRLPAALCLVASLVTLQDTAAAGVSDALPEKSSLSLPESNPDVVGEARDLDTGETLYLEQYYCTDNDMTCSVLYLRPDEKVIAKKQLDYRPSPKAPELTFEDFRLGREVNITQAGPDAVVDAGFDNFVRLQWDDLTDGEQVHFPFRMVGRDDPIKMRASQTGNCAADKLCLQIRLDSWLLGNFIDPIKLVYDKRSQRLLRFRGVSNLRTAEGRTQKVDIVYRYAEEPAEDSSAP